jgi:hypothetical protein
MTHKGLDLAMPATYRIVVQGNLDESWADRLGGLAITSCQEGDEAPVTILYGRLRDQAALQGILTSLYDPLHLPLLSVEYVVEE